MWKQIHPLCPQAHSLYMLMDFEKASINSFQQLWPNTQVKDCFFHLTQNVWRKVQGVGLQARYSQDAELVISIRLLPTLAFAPPDGVPQLFALVAEQLDIPESRDLILYFENTYIGRVLPGGSSPLFPSQCGVTYYLETPFGLRKVKCSENWLEQRRMVCF